MSFLPVILGLILHCLVWPMERDVWLEHPAINGPQNFVSGYNLDAGPVDWTAMSGTLRHNEAIEFIELNWHGAAWPNWDGLKNVSNLVLTTTFKPTVTESNGVWTILLKQ